MRFDEIIIGRSDSTVTVFVPWDCGNNCPFCTTKQEYREVYGGKSLDEKMAAVERSLRRLANSEHIENVVFTGGEPFADMDRLGRLIEEVPGSKRCFVNTSLHISDREGFMEKVGRCRIDGISLSSHIADEGFFDSEVLEFARGLGDKIKIRVNSLVKGDEDVGKIRMFCRTVLGEGGFEYLNLRADYRKITPGGLGTCEDEFFRSLMAIPDWRYQGFRGCLVCRTDMFETPYGRVDYHRGTERTALVFGRKLVINDFVVKQDGEMRFDWDKEAVITEEMAAALGL